MDGPLFIWMEVDSRTYLPYISPASPLHLPYISPTSPLHLPYLSPPSPQVAFRLGYAPALRVELSSAVAAQHPHPHPHPHPSPNPNPNPNQVAAQHAAWARAS